MASGNGHLDVVDKLLDKGANIEATNKVRKS
jgi:ankyrin repeat protein